MSLFKVKQWWSNNKWQEKAPDVGISSPGCVKIDKFNSDTDSDCIMIAEDFFFRVYKPSSEQDVSDLLLETKFNDVVIHIETGKFIGEPVGRQIIVLHPLGYAVYQLEKKDGHTSAGDQNALKSVLKRTFTRRAHCLVCGPFGSNKTRDLICVQGLDGSLSFFDQESFLFMCIFNDVIIPGPVSYIASCDSFVISKSTWMLEIYSYQQLREFSEPNLRQNKKNIPQWAYNAGEEVSSVQVIQTSSNFSTIVALGERYLYCFQDNGLMKFMLKFEYMPICFCAYLIGWYYEPNSRLLVMVASDDSKLYLYEGTTLLWSCDVLETAIYVSRCFLKSLSGGLVTLTSKGIISISYLGTEPDLNSNAAAMMNEVVNPEQVHTELQAVEEELQSILENNGEETNQSAVVMHMLNIKADIGKPTQSQVQEYPNRNQEFLHLMMCPVVLILSCDDPKLINNIQVTYVCSPPFTCSQSVINLDNVNGTEIIESQIFLSNDDTEITDMKVEITLAITDNIGKISVLSKNVLLPMSLYCFPTNMDTSKTVKLNVYTNHPNVYFGQIITDFTEEELYSLGNSTDTVSLAYRATNKVVTLKALEGYYSLEADDFPEIAVTLQHLIIKLTDHFIRMGVKDFKFHIEMNKELFKQITFRFLKSVETHAKDRITLRALENELNVLQKQFIIVQKRLLVQYGSLPPGDCEPLEFLMRDTHKRLMKCVNEIINCKKIISRSGGCLETMGRLMIFILSHSSLEPFKLRLVEETLCLNCLYDDYQEWEEAVTQSLSYILNKVFMNTEKDREKLAPVTEQGILSQANLKRFIKQIRIVLDKLFAEAYNDQLELRETNKESKTVRTEEFVEMI